MKRIRWPFWAVLGAAVAAWLILGFTLTMGAYLDDVYDVGAVSLFFAVVAFIVVYTVAGLTGPAKWWKTNIGTYLILAAVSVLLIIGPLAAAVLFHGGRIDTWWWVWTWIGGHFLAAAMWALLAALWLRNPNGKET